MTSYLSPTEPSRAIDASVTRPARPVPRIVAPRRRLHALIKLLVLGTYSIVTLLDTTVVHLLALSAIALVATLVFRLPWRSLFAPLIAIGLLVAGLVWPVGLLPLFVMGAARVLCIAQYLAIFGARTSTSEILELFSIPVLRRRSLSSLTYLFSTTLAVLPSIQQDMRKSLEGAILRRGRPALLVPTTWVDIVLHMMARATLRSQRLADAVSDRGYSLTRGLAPLPGRRLGVRDALIGAALLLPVLLVIFSRTLAELPQVAPLLNVLHDRLRELPW